MQQRIGQKLLAAGLISREQLDRAVEQHEATGKFLGQVLVECGAIDEAGLARALADQLDLPFVDLDVTQIDPSTVRLYAASEAEAKLCFPYRMSQGALQVAMANPLDVATLEDLAFVSGCTVKPAVAASSDILAAIAEHSPPVAADSTENLLQDIDRSLGESKAQCETISILSNKGGVGKTHLAINLAYHLAKCGKKVLLIDADMGNADISNKLGIYPKQTVLSLLDADEPPDQIITPTPHGFDLIGGYTGDFRLANLQYIQRVLFVRHFIELAQPYDYMLLDLGAGISSQVIDMALATDRSIVATTCRDVVSAYACAKVAFLRHVALQRKLADTDPDSRSERFFCPYIVVGQLAYDTQGVGVFERISSACRNHLNNRVPDYQMIPQYLGGVLFDDAIRDAETKRQPVSEVAPRSQAAKCYQDLARNLCGPREPEAKKGLVFSGLTRLARILRLRPDDVESD